MKERKEPISQRDVDEINADNNSYDKFNEILNDPSEQAPWPETSLNDYSKAAQASSMAMLRSFQLEARIALCADLKVNGQSVSKDDLFRMTTYVIYNMPGFKMYESTNDKVCFLDKEKGDTYEVVF